MLLAAKLFKMSSFFQSDTSDGSTDNLTKQDIGPSTSTAETVSTEIKFADKPKQ